MLYDYNIPKHIKLDIPRVEIIYIYIGKYFSTLFTIISYSLLDMASASKSESRGFEYNSMYSSIFILEFSLASRFLQLD